MGKMNPIDDLDRQDFDNTIESVEMSESRIGMRPRTANAYTNQHDIIASNLVQTAQDMKNLNISDTVRMEDTYKDPQFASTLDCRSQLQNIQRQQSSVVLMDDVEHGYDDEIPDEIEEWEDHENKQRLNDEDNEFYRSLNKNDMKGMINNQSRFLDVEDNSGQFMFDSAVQKPAILSKSKKVQSFARQGNFIKRSVPAKDNEMISSFLSRTGESEKKINLEYSQSMSHVQAQRIHQEQNQREYQNDDFEEITNNMDLMRMKTTKEPSGMGDTLFGKTNDSFGDYSDGFEEDEEEKNLDEGYDFF